MQRRGIRFSPNFLVECASTGLATRWSRLHSIRSTLDFAECLGELFDPGSITVEPHFLGSRPDLSLELDGSIYLFEMKSPSLASGYQQEIIQAAAEWQEPLIGKFGMFAKAVFVPASPSSRVLTPIILERRRVSETVLASYGVLTFPIGPFYPRSLKRTIDDTKKSYSQLKNGQATHKVSVLDLRFEAVNESRMYSDIVTHLARKTYRELSGVILIRLDSDKVHRTTKVRLLPIPNPSASNPLDPKLFSTSRPRTIAEPHSFVVLATKIHVEAHKWADLIEIQPGYKIMHKGVQFGTL